LLDKLIDFLISVLDLFRFWSLLPPEQAGFVRRFGLPVRDLKPGLNFLWPFNVETTTKVDMRLWADVLPAQSLRTADGVEFVVRLMVSYQVQDPRKMVLECYDAGNNVLDIAAGALGTAISRAVAEDVDSGKVLRKVRSALTTAAKGWGIQVHRVQFADCTRASSHRLFGATKDEN
jgi:regulator of protease activity HflC (stomatin/prohibitin superfamily)